MNGDTHTETIMATKHQLRQRWKKEPGATIWQGIVEYRRSRRWKYDVTPDVNDINQTIDSKIVFALLDDLPFREEVPSGRDLRGVDSFSGWRSDFSDTDFSFSVTTGNFFHCNLETRSFRWGFHDKFEFRRSSKRLQFPPGEASQLFY